MKAEIKEESDDEELISFTIDSLKTVVCDTCSFISTTTKQCWGNIKGNLFQHYFTNHFNRAFEDR